MQIAPVLCAFATNKEVAINISCTFVKSFYMYDESRKCSHYIIEIQGEFLLKHQKVVNGHTNHNIVNICSMKSLLSTIGLMTTWKNYLPNVMTLLGSAISLFVLS